MTFRLRTGPAAPGFSDPFEMLAGCHDRIRTFTDLARRLATAEAPADEIAEAGRRLHLYFGTALPLHEEDEEQTLFAALRDAGATAALRLFDGLRDDHRAIEGVVGALLPIWDALARAPDRLPGEQRALLEGALALDAAFGPHLAMEERELYPLAERALDGDARAPMLRAMLARRQPVFGAMATLGAHAGRQA